MLDDHNSSLSEELLGVVVDELSVNEYIRLVSEDALDLIEHFLLLGLFDFTNSAHGVDLNFGAHNFDFIVVHRSVSNQDTAVLGSLVASSGDGLLKDETISDEADNCRT